MTTETPCRYPECECDVTGGRCPNAKPAEPPACGCHGPCGSADCCERCAEPQGSEGSEPLRGLSKGSALGLANAQRREAELLAPLKAEIAALKAERDALRDRLTTAEKCVSAAKSVIDGMEREIGGAHVDIIQKVAENAALKARVEELREFVADIAEDNCVEGCGCGFVAKQVLAEDDVSRKEQEASNGK